MSELRHAARSREARTAFNKFPLYINVTSDKTILQGKEEMYLFCGNESERLKLEDSQSILGNFKDSSTLRKLSGVVLLLPFVPYNQWRLRGEHTGS